MTDASPTSATEAQQATPPKTPPGFLRDPEGKPSSMRLMSIISLFAGIGFGWMTLKSQQQGQAGQFITVAFLIGAFIPKSLQKFIENYYPFQRPGS